MAQRSNQSVFPNKDESGNFRATQTASTASSTVFQQDDTRFKATGMVAQPMAFGAAPGMGPPVSAMPFGGGLSNPGQQMQMQKGQFPQQNAPREYGGLPKQAGPAVQFEVVAREASTEPAPMIRREDVNMMRSMIAEATPDETIRAFQRGCSELRILDVEENAFKLEGRFFSESHKMAEFYVGVYTLHDSRRTVVEVNSSQGPVFQEFLTKIFGMMKASLANFESHVNTDQAYNWSPLPLPLGMEEDTPSSPDVGGTLTDVPAMLPFGYPPEISLSLGFSSQDDDPDAQKRTYLEDLVDSLETGYAREIADAAPNLAVESEDEDSIKVLRTVENVVPRLMTLVTERKDACLVRSCVITLGNLMQDSEFSQTQDKETMKTNLEETMRVWSERQNTVVEGEFIPKSEEIKTQINLAMMHL